MYRKKRRSWTKHVDFMLLDVLCMQLAFVISYIIRFGTDNPYTDGDYRTLAIAFLFIDFFVYIVSDSFKNVLKRGYFDEFIATCRHVILVELIVTFYLFTTQTGSFYSRLSYYIMVPFYIVTDYAARVIWKKILRKIGFNSAKITFDHSTGKNPQGDPSDRISGQTRLCKSNRSLFGYRS